MKAEHIINAAKALDNIEKPKGFSEIKIIKSPFVKDGNPILLVSENDYKQFEKEIPETPDWIRKKYFDLNFFMP